MCSKIVAIIPARKGSKRLPGKNKRLLCGKPLIIYTIEQVLGCDFIDEVIVSTDDLEILRYQNFYEEKVKFTERSENLSQDDSSIDDVVLYELREYPDDTTVILLQPTSPLREMEDIEACYYTYKGSNNLTIIPVFREDEYHFKLNGSIFIINLGLLRRKGSIFNGYFFVIYKMPKERSVDIDTLEGFQEAERLMKKRLGK